MNLTEFQLYAIITIGLIFLGTICYYMEWTFFYYMFWVIAFYTATTLFRADRKQ